LTEGIPLGCQGSDIMLAQLPQRLDKIRPGGDFFEIVLP
jgi:hypothetical protein